VLDDVPVLDSWLLPALVLSVGFGLGSLVTAWGVWRRPRWPWLAGLERLTPHHWSWTATLLIGAGQATWIGFELAYLPEMSWLQPLYGCVGLALLLLVVTRPVRRFLAGRRPV
jgi:hypothetical protein